MLGRHAFAEGHGGMNGVGEDMMTQAAGNKCMPGKQEEKQGSALHCHHISLDLLTQEGLRNKCDNLLWGLKRSVIYLFN